MAYFRITGDLPGLKGLIVEGEYRYAPAAITSDKRMVQAICVLEIINPDAILGDRTVRFPIPENALFINDSYLVPVDAPTLKQFTAESPFGKLLFEGHYAKGMLKVDYVKYDNGVSVTIREEHEGDDHAFAPPVNRTIYTQNFFEDSGRHAIAAIEDVLVDGMDVEDLVFKLKELKGEERLEILKERPQKPKPPPPEVM